MALCSACNTEPLATQHTHGRRGRTMTTTCRTCGTRIHAKHDSVGTDGDCRDCVARVSDLVRNRCAAMDSHGYRCQRRARHYGSHANDARTPDVLWDRSR